ncbi:MAG: GNAT family N-acetyltransferase, partial [Candidatus Competibacteraceae bacterium]|nr:GNAT family N-acetyltransferase [Candidatus Competibacteraceae bacterium]
NSLYRSSRGRPTPGGDSHAISGNTRSDIGSVRARAEAGTCHIGRLIVHPDRQNQGIGRQLMAAIEARFPEAQRFELFTGDRSGKNLGLYAKLGYREFKREPLGDRVTLVYLEKMHQRGV